MKTSTFQDYQERIFRVLLHIQSHLDENLPLAELAQVACFSPCHFHRIFTGMTGESLHEHVRRLRLERAAVQLKLGAQPITQIGLDAGYDAPEAFTRAFKAAYGLAPAKYRARKSPLSAYLAPWQVHVRKGRTWKGFKKNLNGVERMKVELKRIGPMRVAFLRHTGPYGQAGTAWDRLLPSLGKAGWIGGDSMFIGVCHDDPEVTPPQKIRYDACVTVGEKFVPAHPIGVQTIAGGGYAVTTHFGPYDQLGRTYAKLLGQWLPPSGRELRSTPCFEVYLNSPESTDPEDLITDIYAPLRKSGHARKGN